MLINFYSTIIKQSIDCNPLIGEICAAVSESQCTQGFGIFECKEKRCLTSPK